MNIKLLTEHHLEFLSLKRGCTGSFESIHFKMPHCWKSNATAHFLCTILITDKTDLEDLIKKMFEERRNTPPMKGKETLVDHILSFTDDPEVHLADGLEFTTAGLYTIEACK